MLTAFYGGRLSQDRINYEVFKDDEPGPQGDLNWGRGYSDQRKVRAIRFALGREPTIEPLTDELFTGALVYARIQAGTPMMGCKTSHCVAIVGASPDVIVINDPWVGTYLVPMRNVVGARLFVMANADDPRPWPVQGGSDEAEVSSDTDGDGVVDFDEIHRFKTNPNLKDSDDDELPEKEDIRASVHDRRHGFAYGGSGRDYDGDGTMMELDADADEGGCLDGWEDTNKNGKFERPESDNFDKRDDPCVTGTYSWKMEETWEQADRAYTKKYNFGQQYGTIKLRPLDDSRLEGRATVHFDSNSATTLIYDERRCDETTRTSQPDFSMRLVGESRRLQNGHVQLTFSPDPDARAPPVRLHWTNSCSTIRGGSHEGPSNLNMGLPVNQQPTLVDGVYDDSSDTPIPRPAGATGGSGKTWVRVHLEQKRPG